MRVALDIADGTAAQVREMVRLSGAADEVELVRWALAVYDLLLRERAAGNVVQVKEANGRAVPVALVPLAAQGGVA